MQVNTTELPSSATEQGTILYFRGTIKYLWYHSARGGQWPKLTFDNSQGKNFDVLS